VETHLPPQRKLKKVKQLIDEWLDIAPPGAKLPDGRRCEISEEAHRAIAMRDSPTAHTSLNMWTRRSKRQKEIAKAKGLHRPLDHASAHPLTHDDHVVVEATGNAAAVSEVLAPHVGRVVIANPRQVRLRGIRWMQLYWHVSMPAASCLRPGFPTSAH
jgi:hypothetical protein